MIRDIEPVCDEPAEDAVISSCILSPEAWESAREFVTADDFYIDRNRMVFGALAALDSTDTRFDIVTIAGHLKDQGTLDRVGGVQSLARLVDATPAVAHVADHAARVAALARQRRVVAAARAIVADGQVSLSDVDEYCNAAERDLANAIEAGRVVDGAEDIGAVAGRVVTETMQRSRANAGFSGYRSGFDELDRRISGWEPGLYVIAGRPGMGKSGFVLWVLLGISADQDALAVLISLEMPKEQVAQRALAGKARVPIGKLRANNIRGFEDVLVDAAAELNSMHLKVQYRPGCTLADVKHAVRRAQREKSRELGRPVKVAAIGVDYLQLMSGGGNGRDNREQEVSKLSRGLKVMSGPDEFDCPVIALSQLNRSVETRNPKNKRPQLSDLRESGAIEQDADAIFFIYRDEYYFEDSPDQGQAEVIVAKQRNGPTGTVKLYFRGEYALFENMANASDAYFDDLAQPLNAAHIPWNETDRDQ